MAMSGLHRGQQQKKQQQAKEEGTARHSDAAAPAPMGAITSPSAEEAPHAAALSSGGDRAGDIASAKDTTFPQTPPGRGVAAPHLLGASASPGSASASAGPGAPAAAADPASASASAAVQLLQEAVGGAAPREAELALDDLPAPIQALVGRTVALYGAPPSSPATRAILDDFYSRCYFPSPAC